MSLYLSDLTQSRDNNFNLIRFIAASLVLVSHSYPLTGDTWEPLASVIGITFGHLAVDIFFITSGLLVTASLVRRSNLFAFTTARAARIYPGLIVSVLFCAFLVGPVFTTINVSEYLNHPATYSFIKNNSLLVVNPIQYALPGVFEGLAVKNAVNGSLWTLPEEVTMYFILAVLGFLLLLPSKLNPSVVFKATILLLCAAATVAYLMNHHDVLAGTDSPSHRTRFISVFFMGSALFLFREKIRISWAIFLPLVTLNIFLARTPGFLFFTVFTLSLPYIIIFLAYVPKGFIRRFNSFGDYSYGIYIYAFPVQQSFAYLNPGIEATPLTLLSFPVTLLLAIASWHFIEKPSLKWVRKKPQPTEKPGLAT